MNKTINKSFFALLTLGMVSCASATEPQPVVAPTQQARSVNTVALTDAIKDGARLATEIQKGNVQGAVESGGNALNDLITVVSKDGPQINVQGVSDLAKEALELQKAVKEKDTAAIIENSMDVALKSIGVISDCCAQMPAFKACMADTFKGCKKQPAPVAEVTVDPSAITMPIYKSSVTKVMVAKPAGQQ